MNYKITTDGALEIYFDDEEIPFLYQPHWPNGTKWGKGEAEAWGKQFILAANDPTADWAGDGPDQPTKPRPEIIVEPEQQ